MSRPSYEGLETEDIPEDAVPLATHIDDDEADSIPLGLGHDRTNAISLSIVERKRLWWRNAIINLLFIASWFFFATILSVYNKWMFSPDKFGFTWPFFVTSLHMFTQFGLSSVVRYLWPKKFKPAYSPSPSSYVKKVAPTAITTSLDIGLSNVSLEAITLSFYTMCKSSSLIFVLSFAFLFRLETFSLRLVSVILLIVAGVLLMVATETQFSLPGFIFVISASALGGLRWSLTQLLLRDHKLGLDTPVATLFWMAPLMGVTLLCVSFAVDSWTEIFGSKFFVGWAQTGMTVFFLVIPGVLAFCMVLSEIYIIQRAGVVPMSIAGIAKEVTTISIAAWFFHDELTPLNIVGVCITISGIALFTYHKYQKSIQSRDPLDPSLDVFGTRARDAEYMDLGEGEEGQLELVSRNSSVVGLSDRRRSLEGTPSSTSTTSDILFTVENSDDSDLDSSSPTHSRSHSRSVSHSLKNQSKKRATSSSSTHHAQSSSATIRASSFINNINNANGLSHDDNDPHPVDNESFDQPPEIADLHGGGHGGEGPGEVEIDEFDAWLDFDHNDSQPLKNGQTNGYANGHMPNR